MNSTFEPPGIWLNAAGSTATLSHMIGTSLCAIAEDAGLLMSVIKNRLYRARLMLRESLAGMEV